MTATTMEGGHRTQPRVAWGSVISVTLLTLFTVALVWLAAVPFGSGVCPAIEPTPTNCLSSHRAGSGLVATIAVGSLGAAAVLLVLLRRSWTRPLVVAATVLLAVSPFISYAAVSWSPGFVLWAPASGEMTDDPVGTWGEAAERSAYLIMDDDGTVRGSDGCNGLYGSWSITQGVIEFSDMVSSLMMCPPDEPDRAGIHGPIVTAVVDGDLLRILDGEGNVSGVLQRAG